MTPEMKELIDSLREHKDARVREGVCLLLDEIDLLEAQVSCARSGQSRAEEASRKTRKEFDDYRRMRAKPARHMDELGSPHLFVSINDGRATWAVEQVVSAETLYRVEPIIQGRMLGDIIRRLAMECLRGWIIETGRKPWER